MGKIVQITGLGPHLGEGSRNERELFLEKTIRNKYGIGIRDQASGNR
jgi:hypothetical protein